MLFLRKDPFRRTPAPERRAAPRLDKVIPVYLDGERGAALGVARNISEGGMFVETRAPEPIGSQVRVIFAADEGEMTAVAEVRFVCHLVAGAPEDGRPATLRGMGLRFLYFEPGAEAPGPSGRVH